MASAAVSVRKLLAPRRTILKPAADAWFASAAERPPSGPTSRLIDEGGSSDRRWASGMLASSQRISFRSPAAPSNASDRLSLIIISGGKFHSQPLALAFDYIKIAMAVLGNISERRTFQ